MFTGKTSNRRTGRQAIRAGFVGLAACAALVVLPAGASASGGGIGPNGEPSGSSPTVRGSKAKLKRNGKAVAPAKAPRRVKRAIAAANKIDDKGYRLGGGHGKWRDNAYDCSGAVSYALGKPGAKIVKSSMPSGSYARYGSRGKGNWITWYGDGGHVFVVIAGLRFDTSQPDDGERGPGWSKNVRAGFANVSRRAARHRPGL